MPPYSLYTRDGSSVLDHFMTSRVQSLSFRLRFPRHTLTPADSVSGTFSSTDSLPPLTSGMPTFTISTNSSSSPTPSPTLSLSTVSSATELPQSNPIVLSSDRPHTRDITTVVVPSVLVPVVVIGVAVILGAIFFRRRRVKRTRPVGESFLPDDGFGAASHGTGSKNSVSISASDPQSYAPVAQEDGIEAHEWQLVSPASAHPFATYSPTLSPPADAFEWIPAEQTVGERRPSYTHRRTIRVLRALADAEPTPPTVLQPRLD